MFSYTATESWMMLIGITGMITIIVRMWLK